MVATLPRRIEFFFDCSSPWTYFALHRIRPLAEAWGTAIEWRPILVGGVFNAVNRQIYELRGDPPPAKARYATKSLHDWARHVGVPFAGMPPHHPVNSVRAMRLLTLLLGDDDIFIRLADALFHSYFVVHRDIADPAVLAELCGDVGVDADLLARTDDPATKDRLRSATQELIDRGGFGSPTIFVDGEDMYFGNDTLPLVRDALMR